MKLRERNTFLSSLIGKLLLVAGSVFCHVIFAEQFGPTFPTHHFPTDQSFYFDSLFDYASESSTYNSYGQLQPLGGTFTRYRFTLTPEYQPNRRLSLGAFINYDSLQLTTPGASIAKAGLSDQFIFAEYRFIDQRSYSFGFAPMFKLPAYSVQKQIDLTYEPSLLLGDGQMDFTLLLTSEFWAFDNLKFYGDFGITYRTDGHADEVPFNLGMEYVTPKYTFGIAGKGNLSLNNDTATDAISQQLAADAGSATSPTNYVYAQNPRIGIAAIYGEYSFTYNWTAHASYQMSFAGRNSPDFTEIVAGVNYHFFEPAVKRRQYREVDIGTDDSDSTFEGEIQEQGNPTPTELGTPDEDQEL